MIFKAMYDHEVSRAPTVDVFVKGVQTVSDATPLTIVGGFEYSDGGIIADGDPTIVIFKYEGYLDRVMNNTGIANG